MRMPESVQSGIEISGRIVVPIGHRILLEELETMVVTDFLAGVDQRLGVRQSPAKNSHCLPRVTHPLELGAVPRVLVMIGSEHHTMCGAILLLVPLDVLDQAVGVRLALGHIIKEMVKPPGIGAVEAGLVEPRLLSLSKEEKPAGILIAELRVNIRPEVLRHLA